MSAQLVDFHGLALALAVCVGLDVAVILLIVAAKLLRERGQRIAARTREQVTENAIAAMEDESEVDLPPLHSIAGETALETIVTLMTALRGDAREFLASVLEANGYIDGLLRDLQSRDAIRRSRADSLLGATGSRRSIEPLTRTFQQDRSPEVRITAAEAIGAIGDTPSAAILLEAARDPSRYQELRLAAVLAQMGNAALPALEDELTSDNTRLLILVLDILAEIGATARPVLVAQLLGHRSPEVRARAATVLGASGSLEYTGEIVVLTRDPLWFVRLRAIRAMSVLGMPPQEPLASYYLDALHNLLWDETWYVRRHAAAALAAAGPRGYEILREANLGVARSAIELDTVLHGRSTTTLL